MDQDETVVCPECWGFGLALTFTWEGAAPTQVRTAPCRTCVQAQEVPKVIAPEMDSSQVVELLDMVLAAPVVDGRRPPRYG